MGFYCAGTKNNVYILFIHSLFTIYTLFMYVHGSHDIIHMFKNYFVTVILVFNFQFSVSAKISSI